MLLISSDGARVELRPTRYQFPAAPMMAGDWDANWLEIQGRVRTAIGESWAFDDPCLTTWEAIELRDWLQAAAEGRVSVTDAPTEDSDGLLTFTEPNLGFSVAAAGTDSLTLRVHLSLESLAGRPAAEQQAGHDFYAYSVPLRIGRQELLAAARVWQDDLTPFPER